MRTHVIISLKICKCASDYKSLFKLLLVLFFTKVSRLVEEMILFHVCSIHVCHVTLFFSALTCWHVNTFIFASTAITNGFCLGVIMLLPYKTPDFLSWLYYLSVCSSFKETLIIYCQQFCWWTHSSEHVLEWPPFLKDFELNNAVFNLTNFNSAHLFLAP